MLIIGFHGKTIDEHSAIANSIEKDNIGGVILFDLNQQSQRVTQNANKLHQRPNLPLLISVDYEGGKVNRLHQRYGFPEISSPQQIGKSSLNEADNWANLMARTLHLSGFNVDFFPSLDVDVNPDNPIIGKLERSFSSVPDDVTRYAQLYSRQFL